MPAVLYVGWCHLVHLTFRTFCLAMQSYGKKVAQPSAESAKSCAESSKMSDFNGF
jgi:hypothetical protein